jgi:hypothetical protein
MSLIKTLKEAMEELKFDTRLIEQKINQGLLTKEEVQKHLASLEDSAGNSVPLDLDGEFADDLNDEEDEDVDMDAESDDSSPTESH